MLTIAWDVDDVLNDLMRSWFTLEWQPRHPECTLPYSGITENPPDRVLGIARRDYLDSLDAFRASDRAAAMQPNALVLDWLRHCGARYRHMALTARPLESVPQAAEWLFRHYGGYLRNFAVVPSRPAPDVPVYDGDKGEFLAWFGKAGVLVDDSEENIRAAEALGIRGLLYPQPWNCAAAHSIPELLRQLCQLAEVN